MLKKIAVSQLRVGMFIHDLNCGWLDNPFLSNQFKVDSAATLRRIIDTGVAELYIDTIRGADTGDEESPAASPEAPGKCAGPAAPITLSRSGREEELLRAKKLHGDANRLVGDIMHDVRLGKQIELEQCEPLIEGIIDSIFRMPDALLPLSQMKTRDEYTFQHSVSVSALAATFGRAMELPRETIRELALGGMLHDVGKAFVPDEILNKPGKLTDEEFALMKTHAARGAETLKNTSGVGNIAFKAAAEHHERFDGSGYPAGRKGDEISIYGQMMAIVDVYDAITSLRVYHKGMPPTDALKKMFQWSKAHFNPTLVQVFIKSIGIYPAGSLVRMESGRMGIVREVVPDKLLQPVVRVFYHAERQCYLPPEIVDLSVSSDRIVAHESFEKWQIDQARWL